MGGVGSSAMAGCGAEVSGGARKPCGVCSYALLSFGGDALVAFETDSELLVGCGVDPSAWGEVGDAGGAEDVAAAEEEEAAEEDETPGCCCCCCCFEEEVRGLIGFRS